MVLIATSSNKTKFERDAGVKGASEMELDAAIQELRGDAPIVAKNSLEKNELSLSRNRITMNIPVEVNILLGSAEMSVGEISELKGNSIIQLDRRIGDLVDVVVNGVKIARGEVILLEEDAGRFGLRISELV